MGVFARSFFFLSHLAQDLNTNDIRLGGVHTRGYQAQSHADEPKNIGPTHVVVSAVRVLLVASSVFLNGSVFPMRMRWYRVRATPLL